MFKERLVMANIPTKLDGRYVNDGRLVMYGIREGWRWFQGGLWFRREWEVADRVLSRKR